jgi:hypothetical protein
MCIGFILPNLLAGSVGARSVRITRHSYKARLGNAALKSPSSRLRLR